MNLEKNLQGQYVSQAEDNSEFLDFKIKKIRK